VELIVGLGFFKVELLGYKLLTLFKKGDFLVYVITLTTPANFEVFKPSETFFHPHHKL
jgi:hypothetical protein